MSSSEIAPPKWDGSDPSEPECQTLAKLRSAAASVEATKRAPALALSLSGAPRTVALQLEIWKLSADGWIDQALYILGDTYLEDSSDATLHDVIALAQFGRVAQNIHQFLAKVELVLVRAGRHLTAELPAASALPRCLERSFCSDTNRKLVLTAARTELEIVGGGIRSARRILSNPVEVRREH